MNDHNPIVSVRKVAGFCEFRDLQKKRLITRRWLLFTPNSIIPIIHTIDLERYLHFVPRKFSNVKYFSIYHQILTFDPKKISSDLGILVKIM